MQQQTQLQETSNQQLQPQQSQQPQRQFNQSNPPVASPANLKAVNGQAPRRHKHRVAPRVRLRPNRQARPQMKHGISRQVSSKIKPGVTRVDPQAKIESLKLEPVLAGGKPKMPVKLKFSKTKSTKPTELQAVKKAKRPILLKPALPVRAKIALQPRTSNKHPESLYSGKLLKDLAKIVKVKEELVVRTQDLISELCADLKKPWASYNRGSNISPNQLARLLKLYGLKSQGVWLRGVGSFKGYNRKCLIKANKLTRSATNEK